MGTSIKPAAVHIHPEQADRSKVVIVKRPSAQAAAAAPPPPPTGADGYDGPPAEGAYQPTNYQIDFIPGEAPRGNMYTLVPGTTGGASQPSAETYGLVGEAGKPLNFYYAQVANDRSYTGVQLQYRLPGSNAVQTMDLKANGDGTFEGQLNLPADASGALPFWFMRTHADKSVDWDNNGVSGGSYPGMVIPKGGEQLDCTADWQQNLSGPIAPGSALRIDYAPSRLVKQMAYPMGDGVDMWQISAMVSFDGQPAIEVPLGGGDDTQGHGRVMEAAIRVPDNAKNVTLWFAGTDAEGHQYWDSDFKQNYSYPVIAPAGAVTLPSKPVY